MQKPTPKTEVAIDVIFPNRFIAFYATPDAAEEFRTFGDISSSGPERYTLFVDARFDFDEVVQYIKDYGKE